MNESLLSDAGVGIGLRSGGITIYADGSDSLLDLGKILVLHGSPKFFYLLVG